MACFHLFQWRVVRLVLVFGSLWGRTAFVLAESVSDHAVRLSATVQTNPAIITLTWPGDPNATGYTLYRKPRDAAAWGPGTTLPGNATNYVDSNVVAGSTYEYRVRKSTANYQGEGYLYGGLEVPLVESRGKVILVVDNTHAASLSNELSRLQQDLRGDGWTVLRHDVPRMAVDPANTSSNVWPARSNELASVKALITADYAADPINVKAVFLLGHVPVPYSGVLAPDSHGNHVGAWPADVYYGDMDGTWTDSDPSTLVSTNASDRRNWNAPGDGKFDQNSLPSDVDLQVGRVDLANLPAFAQSEVELLRQYLKKDHSFRHKLITAERRGLIDDHLGTLYGEVVAVNGWRNFAPFFGAANTIAGDWLTTLNTQSYLWGYGCGAGTFTSCSGIASTANFAASDPRVVFCMLFGSYFGDWDSSGNLLRAAIATTNYTLASAWVGRPFWFFHHMALGETIGFSARVTQNNSVTYPANYPMRGVHIALMGDPTLRMHPVAPPSALVAITNASAGVDLSWNASPEAVGGYAVYRAPTVAGPFARLNSELISGTNYTDPVAWSGTYVVRAVKLEVTPSGSYWNSSQGIFQDFDGPPGPPVLLITAQSAAKVYGAPLPDLAASYSGFVNGDTTNNLTSQPVLSTPATAASPIGDYPIRVSGAVATNYHIIFADGTLRILPSATTGLLTSSANPSLPGQTVTFTFTVNAVSPGVGTPTGQVQFKIDYFGEGEAVALNNGVATVTPATLRHGSHLVVAEYLGHWNFSRATNYLSTGQTVNTPPAAGADSIERDPTNGVAVSIAALLGNDWDPDGDRVTFAGASASSALGGTVVSNSGWIVYTPPPGFTYTDTFSYTIRDSWDYTVGGTGTGAPVAGTVTVITRGSSPRASLSISNLGGGGRAIIGSGVPAGLNRIQFLQELGGTNWQTLGTATANASGGFQFIDANGSAQRCYRVVLLHTGTPPVIEPLRVTEGVATITWTSITGQTYRLQYKDSLSDTNWRDLLSEVMATGTTTTVTNLINEANQRFYRSVWP